MNWYGDYVQKNISENDTVLSLGCGIMGAITDIVPSYPNTSLKCDKLVGVDIYQPYLDNLTERGIENYKWDLEIAPYPFENKSFDILLLVDIIEHLKKLEYVTLLLKESERIARKKIFFTTPNTWFDNKYNKDAWKNIDDFGSNEYQEHHLLLDKVYLENHNFKIITKGIHWYGYKNVVHKILHVNDMAGVSGCMAKYQKKLGYDVKVIVGSDSPSKFGDVYDYDHVYKKHISGLTRIPKIFHKLIKMYNSLRWYLDIREKINEFNPDIVHIHETHSFPYFIPTRKKILEFHGTVLRTKYENGSLNKSKLVSKSKIKRLKRLNTKIAYSTQDLYSDMVNDSIYIPNPVDTEKFNTNHFKPVKDAVYFWNKYEDKERAEIIANDYNLELTIIDKRGVIRIPFRHIHKELGKYSFFIDRYNIPSLSKLALESLALGLKVIDHEGNVISGLPINHLPEEVTDRTIKLYEKILND